MLEGDASCLFFIQDLTNGEAVHPDGRITESGTFKQLVNSKDSRFRTLMAAQLNATAGDAPVPIAPSTNLDSVPTPSLESTLPLP